MVEIAAHLAKIAQRHSRNGRAAPEGDLAVAVLADDKGVDAAVVHAQMLAQQIAQARRIQHRARAEDAVFGQIRVPLGDAREHVHGVGHDEDIPRKAASFQLAQHGEQDGGVALDQIQPRFARLLVGARRDDRQRRVGGVRIAAGADVRRFGEEQPVRDVLRLSLRAGGVRVDEHHFGIQAVLHEREGAGGTDIAAADDDNFSRIDHVNILLFWYSIAAFWDECKREKPAVFGAVSCRYNVSIL